MEQVFSLSVYALSVWKRGNKGQLEVLSDFNGEHNLLDYVQTFLNGCKRDASKGQTDDPVVKDVWEKKAFRLAQDGQGSYCLHRKGTFLSGVLESGEYGTEETVVNIDTSKSRYVKRKNEALLKPFYFQFYVPANSAYAFLILERIGHRGIANVLSNALQRFWTDQGIGTEYAIAMNPVFLRQVLDEKLEQFPGGKTYGAFNWGDTRIVMLDCGEDKPDDHWVYYGLNDFARLRHDQVDFLKRELSGKAFKKARKRILIHHIPLYGNDWKNLCEDLWKPLLAKAPFDVCLNAHTHQYAYHPEGELGNNFPVIIGGGYDMDSATVMILEKKKETLHVRVLNTEGQVLLELTL